jgi:hypothetical protein
MPVAATNFAMPATHIIIGLLLFALQVLINVLIIFPWSWVLLLSWLVNKWQLMFRPVGAAFW